MSIELKIKAKHLALEPKVIKYEERKLKKQIKFTQGTDQALITKLNSLVEHRKINVRYESRATHLARAFIAGKSYSETEKRRKPELEYVFKEYILPRVLKMVQKYGSAVQVKAVSKEVIAEWTKL